MMDRPTDKETKEGFMLSPISVVREWQRYADSLEARLETFKARLIDEELESIELQEQIDALEARLKQAEEALERVVSVGHNLDCILCGFKDKAVVFHWRKWMPRKIHLGMEG